MKTEPKITNQRPCEKCNAPIRANKGSTFCKACTDHISMFDHLWRITDYGKLNQ